MAAEQVFYVTAGEPGPRTRAERIERFGLGAVAIVECLGILGIAIVLTVLPLAPFVPWSPRVEFPMERLAGGAASMDALVAEIAAQTSAQVSVVERGAETLLRVDGLTPGDWRVQQVGRSAAQFGYVAHAARPSVAVDTRRFADGGWLTIFLAVQAGVFLLIGAGMARWRTGGLGLRTPRPLRAAGVGVTYGLGAFGVGALLAAGLSAAGVELQEQALIQDLLADVDWWRLAPWFIVILPLAEEVLFRGFIFRSVGRRASLPVAYGASAVLFALVHLNPTGFVIYLAVGLCFAAALRQGGSLASAILAHVTYNACVLAVRLGSEMLGG